ncbi:hypothetical protein ASG43_06910 [Aureimonas sp. Leaf454]|uniref:acyl-CoA dehydrogenase family protein n=1 Tax=Aureimonas sp. Leaf454 TaxID=1736381 RepID=UPI0006F80D5E|nr:acyl-CoA dehydrogenase family protein [Aureimonas sp. Leaf454]KQT50971.1 hypothetical protein ASG43_06910 [Aureimonas sp. Leaf454]
MTIAQPAAAFRGGSLDDRVAAALATLPRRSGLDDLHDRDLAPAVAALHREGLLALPVDFEGRDGAPAYGLPPSDVLAALVRIGGHDLSLGRLYEGHVNALQLVCLYGTPDQKRRLRADARAGRLFGVWGADGLPPFSAETGEDGRLRLEGSKRFASGLGLVARALVPYTPPDGEMRLLLLDATDPERMDPSGWRMSGMRASRSGRYDASRLTAGPEDVIGRPGDYKREPYFVGGIWRCAAVQLGAIERIVELTIGALRDGGRLDHPLQMQRVGSMLMEARSARLFVEDAARRVEGGEVDAAAVSHSAYARLRTEAAGLAVMEAAERAIGLGIFCEGHPIEPILRDLRVYLRQANPDGTLIEHTRTLANLFVPGRPA